MDKTDSRMVGGAGKVQNAQFLPFASQAACVLSMEQFISNSCSVCWPLVSTANPNPCLLRSGTAVWAPGSDGGDAFPWWGGKSQGSTGGKI